MPWRFTRSQACLAISLVWLLTRVFQFSQAVPWTFWEVAEAKKQLDYGFVATKGAIINVHYMAGRVAGPEQFNYVNHPYPILWANTLAYSLCGPWGVVAFASLFGLVGCLATYAALRRFYSEKESFWGALLFTLVPANILFNVNPDTSGVAAVFWPVTVWALARARAHPNAGNAWLLGMLVFLSGQVSWSPYSFYPILLLGALGAGWERERGLKWDCRPDLVKAVLLGGALTVAVFGAQIILYTRDWSDLTSYVGRQASSESGVGLVRMFGAIAARSVLSVGPALLLGSVLCLWRFSRWQRLDWLQLGARFYPLIFALCALALRRYFYRERHLYCYLAFPLVILTVEGMRYYQGRFWRWVLAVLAVAGLGYPLIQATIPIVSQTTVLLGQEFHALTKPEQVIVTNLVTQQFPFAAWDVGSTANVALAADRNIRPGVATRAQVEALLSGFKTDRLEILYVLDPARPIDDALRQALDSAPPTREWLFAVPEESASLALRARSLYWKLIGKHQVSASSDHAREMTLHFFPLLLEREADGKTRITKPPPP